MTETQQDANETNQNHLTIEKIGNIAEFSLKVLALVGAVSYFIGWLIYGFWASKNGIYVNQGINVQYIVAGIIPTLLGGTFIGSMIYGVYISKDFEKDGRIIWLSVTMYIIACAMVFIATAFLVVLTAFSVDSNAKSPLEPTDAQIFTTWGIYIVALFIINTTTFSSISIMFSKGTKVYIRIIATIIALIFTAISMITTDGIYKRYPDYLSMIPKQLGGTKATKAFLYLEDAPSVLFNENAKESTRSGKSKLLDIIYFDDKYFIVKLSDDKSFRTFQLKTDSIKSIESIQKTKK